jgi:hypothetical protein
VFAIFPQLEQNILGQKFTHDRSADDFDRVINKLSHRLLSAAQRNSLSNLKANAAVVAAAGAGEGGGAVSVIF